MRISKTLLIFAGGTLISCSDLSIMDSIVYQVTLTESAKRLDQQELPALAETNTIAYWSKPQNPTYKTVADLFSLNFSYILAVESSATGTIFSIHSNSNNQEGRISINNGLIRASRFSDANNYSYIETAVPPTNALILIAASFAEKSGEDDLVLLINGIIQKGRKQVGTPYDFSYLQKTVTITPSGGSVLEYLVYNDYLSKAKLNVMSRYMGRDNSLSYVAYDPQLLNPDGGSVTADDALLIAAKTIIDAKCISCHTNGSSGGDLTGLSKSKALANGWVVAGSPVSSKLYYRLTGSMGPGTKDMPRNDSISASEVQVIADWISSLD